MNSISVVIPTRGRHHFLRQALTSVIAQTYPPQEIIVVDDGTGAAEAVGQMHPSITVLDNRERGPVPARNMGVAHASGEVICFLDDDDWFTDETYFEKAALAFGRGSAFCYADGIMAFEDGRESLPFAFHADAETLTRDNVTAAVHYIRFEFTPQQVEAFASGEVEILCVHPAYVEVAILPKFVSDELLTDLRD